jgi:hypothetical protein
MSGGFSTGYLARGTEVETNQKYLRLRLAMDEFHGRSARWNYRTTMATTASETKRMIHRSPAFGVYHTLTICCVIYSAYIIFVDKLFILLFVVYSKSFIMRSRRMTVAPRLSRRDGLRSISGVVLTRVSASSSEGGQMYGGIYSVTFSASFSSDGVRGWNNVDIHNEIFWAICGPWTC